MLDINMARKAADEHHKWFMEEATPAEQKAFLNDVCPPEPGDYYDERPNNKLPKRGKK